MDNNTLQSEVLENQIHSFQTLIDNIEKIQASNLTLKVSMADVAYIYGHQQSKIKEKLEKLLAFNETSCSIFGEIDTLLNEVQRGLLEILNQKYWNESTGEFYISVLNTGWIDVINNYWEKREKEIMDTKSNEALNKLCNVDENGDIISVKWVELCILLKNPKDITEYEKRALERIWDYDSKKFDLYYQKLIFYNDYFNLGLNIEKDKEMASIKAFDKLSLIISPVIGFEYNYESNYYYTNKHSIQSYCGFMDLYDELGVYLGMNLDTEVINFNSGGKEYRLQLWKGSYGFTNAYGGEIGLYYKNPDSKNVLTSIESKVPGLYPCVEEDEQITMVSRIYDKENPDKFLIKNDTKKYAEEGKHFWNLAIKTALKEEKKHVKEDLFMKGELEIEDEDKRNSLFKALKINENIEEVNIDGEVVTFKWAK